MKVCKSAAVPAEAAALVVSHTVFLKTLGQMK